MKLQTEKLKLSSSQETAVTHRDGPALVLAGPGSGKTFVITSRIAFLIRECRIKPSRILVITFSRAAARQMQTRFEAMSEDIQQKPVFGTFHSIFFRILQAAYGYQVSSILKESEQYQILQELCDRQGFAEEGRKELVQSLVGEISRVKNEQIDPVHFYSSVCSEEGFRKVFEGYHEKMRELGKLDFDDMLVYTKELFLARADILAYWQNRFDYILVDEFQDINPLQYDILRMLAAPKNNLFVVGDDDQAIYRFRGAKPEIMLGFPKNYPGCSVLNLTENYRCPGHVIESAGKVIRENKKRFKKSVYGVQPAGEPVHLHNFTTPDRQSAYIVRCIRSAHRNGDPYHETAILTRTNTEGRFFAQLLMQEQIPFVMKELIPDLYDHWIAQDILAYIRMGLGSRQRQDFLRVMNKPVRYISRDMLTETEVSFAALSIAYQKNVKMKERLWRFKKDVERIGKLTPGEAVRFIRAGIGYDTYLDRYALEHGVEQTELYRVAEELEEQASMFDDYQKWSDHVLAYREELEKQREEIRLAGKAREEQREGVVLSTLHAAKGLEYKYVFLPDLNESVLPHKKARLAADLEEERRLLYVGMTRAKKELHLSFVSQRYGKKMEPSPFLRPLLYR